MAEPQPDLMRRPHVVVTLPDMRPVFVVAWGEFPVFDSTTGEQIMDRRQLRPLFETRFATSVAAGPITRPGELGFLFGLPCFMTQPDGLAEIIGDEGVQALGSQQRPVPGSAILNIRLLGYTYAGVYADKAEPRPIYLVQVDPVQLGEMSGRSEALYQARYVEYHELMAEIKRRGMDRSPQHNFAAANDAFLQGFLAVRFSSGPGF